MVNERVLDYSRSIVAQEKSWDCGPATAQIILNSAGVNQSEDWLIGQIGTTEAGTNHAGLITPVLNSLLPGSGYTAVWLPKDPPSKPQVEKLWADVTKSIDCNRGVVLNFEAPPNNFPRGTRGSVSPDYRGLNTIYHYVAGMGYADDGPGGRHVWVADPGFRPFGYWCSLEQVATLIVPHAYAWASTAKPVKPTLPAPKPPMPPTPPPAPILTWKMNVNPDVLLAKSLAEIGYAPALELLADMARSDNKQDSDIAKLILANIERTNPVVLQQYLKGK